MTRVHSSTGAVPPARCRSAGFTLVELLVAIVILLAIMTAAFGAVRVAGRSVETGNQRADASDETRALVDFLRRQFGQLVAVSRDHEVTQFAFAGETTRLRFIASAPSQQMASGLMVYTLSADPESDRLRLVLAYDTFDPGTVADLELAEDVDDDSRRRVLTDDLASVNFRYFGAKAGRRSAPAWHETWLGHEDGMPQLVSIVMESNGDSWPELVFLIRSEDPG